jgi:peptidoglycan hydrolase-like protein with peptidoglycan-binding domain
MNEHASKQPGASRALDAAGAVGASPGKRTLVEQLYSPAAAVQRKPQACPTCGATNQGAACPTCAAGVHKAIAGNPVAATPLTEADRAADLSSTQLAGDPQLQSAFDNRPPLGFGSAGPAIKKVQQALIDLGFLMPRSTQNGTAPPDGIFGQETLLVVKGFQFRQGIQGDGVLGRQTLGELDGLMTGSHVPGTPASTDATQVTATDVRPRQFLPCGGFDWAVDFTTDGRNGYLVQEINTAVDGKFCDGSADTGLSPDTPRFWEAWRVQTDGGVHGSNPNDTFGTGVNAPEHTGTWSITGKVHWVNALDTSFRFSGVAQAGGLLSTTTPPTNLGPVLLTRQVGGRWDCCNGNSSHVPMDAPPPAPAKP